MKENRVHIEHFIDCIVKYMNLTSNKNIRKIFDSLYSRLSEMCNIFLGSPVEDLM